MDQNPLNPSVGGETAEPNAGPLIRTMSKDIESLKKKNQIEETVFQPPEYEPPPEIPLGMAPPAGESIVGGPPIEIPAPPADLAGETLEKKSEAIPSPAQQIPPESAIETSPPPPLAPTVPSPPTETIISEKALTEFVPPQPPKKDVKKLALIAGIVGLGIIFGLAGWFLYPKIFPTNTPAPTTPIILFTPTIQTPTATPSPSPTPIVFFLKMPEKIAVLDVNAQTKNELIKTLKDEVELFETQGTLKIIDLRQNAAALTFSQFANLLGLNFPADLSNLIEPEFKLFVNYHAQEGSKLGLILFVSDPMEAEKQLKNWENTMSDDLVDLFLKSERGQKTQFRDGDYRGVKIRYLPYTPPFALDYGIYDHFLIISTSRFSFTNAVDHLLGSGETD